MGFFVMNQGDNRILPIYPVEDGARCRVRTCDFLRVKQALYH